MKNKITLILLIGFTLFSCKKNEKEQTLKQKSKDTLEAIATIAETKKNPKNISSECKVLDFTEEKGRTFVKVQLIDLIENENGWKIKEKDKRTFELAKENFKSCLEQPMSIDEIKTIWKQKKTDDHWYYINVENGTVTEFYLQNCAG